MEIFFPNGDILNTISTQEFWKGSFICIICFILNMKKVHPIKVIILAAVLGVISC